MLALVCSPAWDVRASETSCARGDGNERLRGGLIRGDDVSATGVRQRASIALGGQIAALFLSFVTALVSARWLGASGRGELAAFVATVTLSAVVLGLGSANALGILIARDEVTVDWAWRACLALAVGGGLVTLVGMVTWYSAVSLVRGTAGVTAWQWWLPAAVAATVFSQGQVTVAIASGRIRVSFINTLGTAAMQLGLFLLAWVVWVVPAPATWAVGAWTAAQLGGAVAGWIVLMRSCREPKPARRADWRTLSRYGLAALPGLILGAVNARFDIAVLGWMSSYSEVGQYSMAVAVTALLGIVPVAMAQATFKEFGSVGERRTELLRKALSLTFACVLLIAVVLALASRALLSRLLGAGFETTWAMIWLLLPGVLVFSACHISSSYYGVGLGRPELGSLVMSVVVVVDLVVLVVLGRTWGGIGAALASTAGYIGGSVLNWWFLRRYCGVGLREMLVPRRTDITGVLSGLRRRGMNER
jgi:O-antigen/teichoic acid export membrane protein